MKNLSKTITAISMSLLTVGAVAQSSQGYVPNKGKFVPHTIQNSRYTTAILQPADKVGTPTTNNYLVNNFDGDVANSAKGVIFYYWTPLLYINSAFNNTDTLTQNTANSVTTVFDTLWDSYSQKFVPVKNVDLSVDTIAAGIYYHNTSGQNDTAFLSVNSVTTAGYPGTTVYGVDTVVLTPTTYTYADKKTNAIYNGIEVKSGNDTVQTIYFVKTISIPASARHGWNFGIQVTFHAPKALDTIAVQYFSRADTNCYTFDTLYDGGYPLPIEPTTIGVRNGAVHCVNTFETGMWWFNTKGNYGTGIGSMSWPLTSGTHQGYYYNNGGNYWAPLPFSLFGLKGGTCPKDTAQFNIQDVAIYPAIRTSSNLGVDNITASGLSVGQNFPNPFNQETAINYSLTKSSNVTFTVYDITGRVITTNSYGNVAPGEYKVTLSANTFHPGIYFYTFNVDGSIVTKKMVITN